MEPHGDETKRRRIGVSSWSFHTLFERSKENPTATLMDVRDFPEMIADRYHVHNVEIVLPHFLGAEPSMVRDFKSRLEKAHSRLVHMPLDFGELWNKPAISSTVQALGVSLMRLVKSPATMWRPQVLWAIQ